MSKWKKLVIAVTAGCLVVTGFGSGGASAAPVAKAVAPAGAKVVAQPAHESFKVLSYNVRYNALGDATHKYDSGPLKGKSLAIPAWTVRKFQVNALLKASKPDIFVIYEAEYFTGKETQPKRIKQNMPQDFIDAFGGDYAYYNGPANDPRHGTKLIFYRKKRFRLAPAIDVKGQVTVPNVYSKGGTVAPAVKGGKPVDCWTPGENRYLSYVKLQDINSGRSYFVAAMHPTHKLECFLGRDKNRAVLQSTIENKAGGMSVIAMGDMNTDGECRNTAKEACSKLDRDIISRIEAGGARYNLYRSARHSAPTTDRDATMNQSWYREAKGGAPMTIDYIFHSGGDMTMTDAKVDTGRFFGSKETPSDHYAISAIVRPKWGNQVL